MRMNRLFSVTTLAVLLLLVCSLPLFAQGPAQNQGAGQGQGMHQGMGMGQGQGMQNMDPEQMRERVERYRMWRMIEELDLTATQATEVQDVLSDEQETTRALMEEFQTKKQAIREELEKTNPDEDLLEDLVGDLRALQDEMHEARTTAADELQDVLTPIQQAKYIVFQDEFHQELRQMMMQHRGQGGEGGPGGHGQMTRGSNGRGQGNRGQMCPPEGCPRGGQNQDSNTTPRDHNWGGWNN